MVDNHEIVPRADTLPARSEIMHPAVERLLSEHPTPETLREILNLQREWERDQAKRAYTRALVNLRQDLPAWIARDKTVDFENSKGGRVHYTHASLAATMEAVLPALTSHGFSLAWTPAMSDKGVSVTANLTHRDGHTESATLTAPPDASGSKSTPQAIASTCTLLQRYTALALLGLATADMEEPKGNVEQPAETDKVDSARNMRAMAYLTKRGKTKKQAEEYVRRSMADWTSADLDLLRAWIAPPEPAEEPAREPGADEGEGAYPEDFGNNAEAEKLGI